METLLSKPTRSPRAPRNHAPKTPALSRVPARRLHPAERYLQAVLSGKIRTSKWVRQQVERHYRDLEDGHKRGLVFDPSIPQRVFDFFAKVLQHTEGEWDGKPFVLNPPQQAKIWIIYGWKHDEKIYRRRFKFVYIEEGRGNGKSPLVSGLCLYEFVANREAGSQVYSAATDRDTAKLVWDTAALMVKRSPVLAARIKIHQNNMHVPGTAAKFEPCASEEMNLMGLRPQFVGLDELHAHANDGVWNVFYSAMGKRRNSLMFAITNSGYDRHSVCWKQREYSVNVLDQVFEDDTWCAWIYGLDEEDDWEDESNWVKANPMMGVIVRMEEMRQQAKKAKNDPSALNTFLRFRLSRWTESHSAWITRNVWMACCQPYDHELLRGRSCFGGLDLSTTTDISAFVLLFPPSDNDPKWRVLPRFYLPKSSIEQRVKRDRVPYDVWERQGFFVLTEGRIIDYKVIKADIDKAYRQFDIKEIVFDRWNSSDIVTNLEQDGLTMVEWGQGFASMHAPTKRLMELLLTFELAHDGNPVLLWMALNVMLYIDPAGNKKPDKSKSKEKIDGMVALIMALGRAMQVVDQYTKSFGRVC